MGNLLTELVPFLGDDREDEVEKSRVTDVPPTDPRRNCYPVGSVTNGEFRVEEINQDDEEIWATPVGDHRNILFHLEHVNPSSDLGSKVQQMSEGDYIEIDATRYQKDPEYVPFWCIEAIYTVREPDGVEQNAFRR